MLNKIILIGALVADPEMFYTEHGKPVTRFLLDVTEKEISRFQVVADNHLAETCFNELSKGSLAYIEGRLRLYKRTGKVCGAEVMLQGYQVLSLPKAVVAPKKN